MKFNRLKFRSWRHLLGVCLLGAPILVACAKPTVPVSIHGVNYSGETFSYVLVDPTDPKNTGGSGLIDPYAAGGTDCCYELPKKWRAGMKVTINSIHWMGKLADNTLHDVAGIHLIEVPRYADGKPGELWVLRAADGTMDLVSSDFQPDHPKWPGKVKGWPVPSLAYQRERWDLYIDHQMAFLRAYEGLLAELNSSPDVAARNTWNHSLEHDKKFLAGYSGPFDARFREKLKQDYEKGIEEIHVEIGRLRKGRP